MPTRKVSTYKKKKGNYKQKLYRKSQKAQARLYSHKKLSTLSLKGPAVIPDRMNIKMKYSEVVNVSPATYSFQYCFRGNDIYDPNFTSTGTQPTGRDQWANFYKSYKVLGCKIKVTYDSYNSGVGTIVTLLPSLGSTDYSSIDVNAMIRQPYSKTKMLGTSSGINRAVLQQYFSSKKLFGEVSLEQQAYDTAMGTSPTNVWFYVINAATSDLGTSILGSFLYEITYYVQLSDRVSLQTS